MKVAQHSPRYRLLSSYETWRPIQPLTTVVGPQQRIGTELKKMAPILEPKFPN